jgi:hypothetical protein
MRDSANEPYLGYFSSAALESRQRSAALVTYSPIPPRQMLLPT